MTELRTEILINAPAAQVWNILTGFDRYENWNPFIIRSKGKAVAGTRLENHMQQGEKIYIFKPRITEVIPHQRLEWLGSFMIPGVFDGRHYFELGAIGPSQTRLVQGERFSGILHKLILGSITQTTLQGFNAMNNALKQLAENII